MVPLALLRNLYRYYVAWYRVEHDRSLAMPRSLWSLEVSLQPPTPRQALHLDNLLDDVEWRPQDGRRDYRHRLLTVAAPPRPDQVLAFAEGSPGLKGTRLQVQLLVAPEDRYFRLEFDRDEAWEWLSSSARLTELLLAGTLSDEGLEVERLFHSCYRADQNRDVTDDLPDALSSWEDLFKLANRQAGQPAEGESGEPDGAPIHRKDPPPPSPWAPYRFYCQDMLEARRLVALSREVGLERLREVKAVDEALESRLTPLELADLVSFVRFGSGLGLFTAQGG